MGLLNNFVQTNAQVDAWDRANQAIIKETEHELAVQKGEAEPNEFEKIETLSDSLKTSGVDGKIEFDKPSNKSLDKRDKLYIIIAVIVAIGGVIAFGIQNGWF